MEQVWTCGSPRRRHYKNVAKQDHLFSNAIDLLSLLILVVWCCRRVNIVVPIILSGDLARTISNRKAVKFHANDLGWIGYVKVNETPCSSMHRRRHISGQIKYLCLIHEDGSVCATVHEIKGMVQEFYGHLLCSEPCLSVDVTLDGIT